MLKHLFKTSVVIKMPLGEYLDGEEQFSSFSLKAITTNASIADVESFGAIQSGRVFILQTDKEINLPFKIIYKQKEYDVKNIRECRKFAGKLIAIRCLV